MRPILLARVRDADAVVVVVVSEKKKVKVSYSVHRGVKSSWRLLPLRLAPEPIGVSRAVSQIKF